MEPIMDEQLGPRTLKPVVERKRDLYRPKIHIFRAIIKLFLPMLVICAVFVIAAYKLPRLFPFSSVWMCLAAEVIYVLLRLKSIVIWLVRAYQHYAPDDIRQMCLYTPSCSEYMILAVEKYGVFRGVAKGIDRLSRCGEDSGGEDWP